MSAHPRSYGGLSLSQIIQLQKDGWKKRVRICSMNGVPMTKRTIWMNDKYLGVYFKHMAAVWRFMTTGVQDGPVLKLEVEPCTKPKKPRFI
jgi:hypothetical protein